MSVIAAEAVTGMDIEPKFEPECSPVGGDVPPDSQPLPDGQEAAVPPAHVIVYPMGSRLEVGERITPQGPTIYLALSAPDCQPSWTFSIDPISKQPLISLWSPSEGYQLFPMDKVMRAISNVGHPLHRPKNDCTTNPASDVTSPPFMGG